MQTTPVTLTSPRVLARFSNAEQAKAQLTSGPTAQLLKPRTTTLPELQMPLTTDAFGPSIQGPVKTTLVNGATTYLQQAPNKGMAHLAIQIPLRPEYNAMKLLMSEMLLSGSPQTKALVNHYAKDGIQFSVTEFDENIQLNIHAPTGQENTMAYAGLQILSQPNIDEKYFLNIKNNLLNMVEKVRNKPDVMLSETIAETMYGPSHPYAKTFQSAITEINNQTPYSVLNLYRSIISDPNQVRFSWVSPQPFGTQAQILNQTVQQFGWFRNPYFSSEVGKTPPISPSYVNTIVYKLLPNENVRRATMTYAWHAPKPTSPYYLTFRLMEKIMAGMSSDFFQVLRNQRGLVYSTQRRYNLHREGSDFSVSAQVDFNQIPNALAGFNHVRRNLANMNVSSEALFRAKKMLLLELREAYQSVQGANLDTSLRLENGLPPMHPDQMEAELRRISLDDLAQVSKRVFSRPPVVGISAPKAILYPLKRDLSENKALNG
jgi:predicted Zn-dependent peptidase